MALVLCVPALLAAGELGLRLFPVGLQIDGSANAVTITIDGQTGTFNLVRPLRQIRFVQTDPYLREFQIDGSDATNNFTQDSAYFLSIADTAYYRFQALLRDEASYSTWRDLTIGNGDATLVNQPGQLPEAFTAPLPETFHLSVNLHRIETARTIELEDDTGSITRVEINRNDRFVRITAQTGGNASKELGHWFFPLQWTPFAAELVYMCLRTIALAATLILLITPLAIVIPSRRAIMKSDWAPTILVIALTVGTLAISCYVSVVLFKNAPHILDAVSYCFQGQVLASGHVAASAPPFKDAFPTPFAMVHNGQWFSQYPPGAPLVLALGYLLNVPWLIEPILAAGIVLLIFFIGRRQFGKNVALLAIVLAASSPFLHLMAGSFMSHVPAAFFAACCLYATTRFVQAPRTRWAAAAAASLGAMFLTREVAALLYGLPLGTFAALHLYRHYRTRMLRDVTVVAAVLAVFLLGYCLYNWALTGSPLLSPRQLFDGSDTFGFGNGIGFHGQHTPAAGLVGTDEQLTSLSISLYGWPFYFTLALVVLPFVTRRATRWDFINGLIVTTFVLAYVGYFYHGIVIGPRYYFEALPALVLLTARGFATITSCCASILEKLGRVDTARKKAQAAALILALALLACNAFYFTPRQIELYRNYTGLQGGPNFGVLSDPEPLKEMLVQTPALVTTNDLWIYMLYLANKNSPNLDGDIVFAYTSSNQMRDRLKMTFPDRTWHELQIENGILVLDTPDSP